MIITLLCVGSIKERYWKDAINEYSKRLSPYHKFQITAVKDEKDPKESSDRAIAVVKDTEGQRLLKHIHPDDYVIALAIEGKQFDSPGFADYLQKLESQGHTHLVFIIGGSYGLSDAVMARADFSLSFSKLTFPHQLMRVLFTEQLYRASRINSGQKYHK
jgi:23S rRNA (pseudouridine1915-N3)-methyltransferase